MIKDKSKLVIFLKYLVIIKKRGQHFQNDFHCFGIWLKHSKKTFQLFPVSVNVNMKIQHVFHHTDRNVLP